MGGTPRGCRSGRVCGSSLIRPEAQGFDREAIVGFQSVQRVGRGTHGEGQRIRRLQTLFSGKAMTSAEAQEKSIHDGAHIVTVVRADQRIG